MDRILKEKKVLLIGLGSSGRAAANYLRCQAAGLYVVDDALARLSLQELLPVLPAGSQMLTAEQACQRMLDFSLVVVSPGVPRNHACYAAALDCKREVIGEAELACGFFATKHCIGITGTNGKSTVTLFLEHLLNSQGVLALAIGNLGIPLSAVAAAAIDEAVGSTLAPLPMAAYTHFIMELSSYQLETMHSEVLDLALLLNITPDHLDRYPSMHEYGAAKLRILSCLKPQGSALVQELAWANFPPVAPKRKVQAYGYNRSNAIYTDGEKIFVNGKPEVSLPFPLQHLQNHEVENFLACYGAGRMLGLSPDSIVHAFFSFKKPPHRIEFVAEIEGIKFIDDSKGTNIDAVYRAVESLSGPIILIAGGVDKGASYTPWIEQFGGKVRCICAIGQAAPKIGRELAHAIETRCFPSLEAAVVHAKGIGCRGDTVLLSPGCASFDLFSDYAHRGREFKKIVNNLREQQ